MKKHFILVAAATILLFAFGALAQEKAPAPVPGKPERPGLQGPLARMKEALNITPEQEAKLKAFAQARQTENKAFTEQMKKLRDEMQVLRDDPKTDPNKVNALIDQQFRLQADRAKAMFKNQKEREKIFTPEQLDKIKAGRKMMMDRGFGGGRFGLGLGFGRGGGFGMMLRGRMGGFGGPFMRGRGGMGRFGMMLDGRMGGFGRPFMRGRGMKGRLGMMLRRFGFGPRRNHENASKPKPPQPDVKK